MWAVFLLAAITMGAAVPVHDDVDDVVAKEFHFHLYYFQTNNASSAYAAELVTRITAMSASMDTFIGVPLHLNTKPVGPHPVGSCEVWCPREYFARAYSWFALNRGPLSILIHPLTRHELRDHTDRAAWLGPSFRLDLSVLSPLLDKPPLQYPELHLGYSAPTDAVTRVAMPI
ncbi:unnamed protein product (mitochondrion) [Plasmodiophora brassicae]|uniref:DOPA 4,5-dioxygenase n=1 Tax=Plasmodiophora brassicae TaxID=37360 RepID=A0A0G4IIF1_PLABS|nr:hypothetical protein PBRA_003824 [Plasmodiophora brassicae]SPQ94340.1 unnamed protein product [Plasmodiophora brassicae]